MCARKGVGGDCGCGRMILMEEAFSIVYRQDGLTVEMNFSRDNGIVAKFVFES